MSVDTDLWSAFWTQLTTDVTLLAYVGDIAHFRQGFSNEVHTSTAFPLVLTQPSNIAEDRWIGVPKRKVSFFIIELHHKVFSDSIIARILDSITLDGHVRNAIESSLNLGGAATLVKISDTVWNNLSDNIREGVMTITVITKRFAAGSR